MAFRNKRKNGVNIGTPIENIKKQRAEIKAEKERKKEEERKKSFKQGLLLIGIGLFFAIGALVIVGLTEDAEDPHKGMIQPPEEEMVQLNYEDAINDFKNAGFTNIKTDRIEDSFSGTFGSIDEVETITINGEPYDPENWYKPDDEVLISYHTYKDFDAYKKAGLYKEEEDRVIDENEYNQLEALLGKRYSEAKEIISDLGYSDYYITDYLHVDISDKVRGEYSDIYVIKDIVYVDSQDKVVAFQVIEKKDTRVYSEEDAKSN